MKIFAVEWRIKKPLYYATYREYFADEDMANEHSKAVQMNTKNLFSLVVYPVNVQTRELEEQKCFTF